MKTGSKIKLKVRYVLTLEENAKTSLRHGLKHYLRYMQRKSNRSDLKFAIIHVFHAVELYLKARLSKESPLLIYARPEDRITGSTQTVQFKPLVDRLLNLGVDIEKHRADLNALREIRNCIEHHQIQTTVSEIKDYVAKASRFLDEFLRRDLGIELKDVVKKSNYAILKRLIYSYQERLDNALVEIAKDFPPGVVGSDLCVYECPQCNNKTLTFSKEGKKHCHFCGEDVECSTCLYCGAPVLDKDAWCRNCRENIIDKIDV